MIAGARRRAPTQAVEEARLAVEPRLPRRTAQPAAPCKGAREDELIEHCAAVAEEMPLVGFYLQPAVGGLALPRVVLAPLRGDRQRRRDQGRAVQPLSHARRRPRRRRGRRRGPHHALHRQRRPHRARPGSRRSPSRATASRCGRFRGRPARPLERSGRRSAVELLDELRRCGRGRAIPPAILALDSRVTDCNGAFFDVANDFRGCIAGCHEVLRRQGLLEGIWCLDPDEGLSPGQSGGDRPRLSRPIPNSTTTPSCARICADGCERAVGARSAAAVAWKAGRRLLPATLEPILQIDERHGPFVLARAVERIVVERLDPGLLGAGAILAQREPHQTAGGLSRHAFAPGTASRQAPPRRGNRPSSRQAGTSAPPDAGRSACRRDTAGRAGTGRRRRRNRMPHRRTFRAHALRPALSSSRECRKDNSGRAPRTRWRRSRAWRRARGSRPGGYWRSG